MKWTAAGQFLRFALVGAANTLCNLAVMAVAHKVFGISLWASALTASAVATVQSYVLNRSWTFARRGSPAAHLEFVRFVLLNIAAAFAYAELVVRLSERLPVALATLIAVAVMTIFSFLGSKYFVFRRAPAGI